MLRKLLLCNGAKAARFASGPLARALVPRVRSFRSDALRTVRAPIISGTGEFKAGVRGRVKPFESDAGGDGGAVDSERAAALVRELDKINEEDSKKALQEMEEGSIENET